MTLEGSEPLAPALVLALIHPSAWKWNSRKFASSLMHSPGPFLMLVPDTLARRVYIMQRCIRAEAAQRTRLAAQFPTRFSVTLCSTADTTPLRGWVWTHVNMSPSGLMNRSYLNSGVPGKVLLPVQSAFTSYVPVKEDPLVIAPSELAVETP
jgi:hypothetical protein